MTSRNETVDLMKGVCIITIIIWHAVMVTPLTGLLEYGLTSSALGIFFFLSGYTYVCGKRSPGKNIIHRFKRLMVPFVLYFIGLHIVGGLYVVTSGAMSISELVSLFIKNLGGEATNYSGELNITVQQMISPMWFIVQLVIASSFFYLIVDKVCKNFKIAIIICVVLFCITALMIQFNIHCKYWHLENIPSVTGLLLMGKICGDVHFFERLWPSSRVKSGVLFVILYFLSIILFIISRGYQLMSVGSWGQLGGISVLLAIFQTLIQLYLFLFITKLISLWNIRKVFLYFGQNSLHYYFFHKVVIVYLFFLFGWKFNCGVRATTNSIKDIMISVVTFIITVCINTLWVMLINHKKDKP